MPSRRLLNPIAVVAVLYAPISIAQPASTGSGQAYPVKPIRVIVPFGPGGPSDFLVRTDGQKIAESWGQQLIVDHRTGANGVVGSELAARAAPDGYTLALATNGTHGINTSLFPKLLQYTDAKANDPVLVSLRRKVKPVSDASLRNDEAYATVVAGNIREEAHVLHASGASKNPLSDAAIEEKFLANATPAIGEKRAKRVCEAVYALEEIHGARVLIGLLA